MATKRKRLTLQSVHDDVEQLRAQVFMLTAMGFYWRPTPTPAPKLEPPKKRRTSRAK
jgi:hypothetical protein